MPKSLALGYFSLDIFLNLLVVPCLVLAIAVLLFRKRILIFATAVSCFLIVFYFIQLRAQQDVGQYLSLALIYEAAQFALTESELASSYVPASAVAKLILALCNRVKRDPRLGSGKIFASCNSKGRRARVGWAAGDAIFRGGPCISDE
ncbi:MAG: hypothetical protein IPP88_20840 [Betaproteobacteria bacterium]|nr:hypothetical protein [Betaproteobacteria bacterium]